MDYTKMVCEALKITPTKGRKGYRFDRGLGKWVPRLRDVAFGVVLPNGSTFNKSALDPNSDLVTVLYAIRDLPMTRKEIMDFCFQFDTTSGMRFGKNGTKIRHWYPVNVRGWRTPWFSGIKKAGFVTVDKDNRFHLTGLGARVLRYHGLY